MLDEKTKELIAVGAAVTANCHVCLEYHRAKAIESGATAPEIQSAVDVGKHVRRGAAASLDRLAATLAGAGADGDSQSHCCGR